LAYAIPLVARLLEFNQSLDSVPSRALRALILAPTRELVVQVHKHIADIIRYTDLKVTIELSIDDQLSVDIDCWWIESTETRTIDQKSTGYFGCNTWSIMGAYGYGII
jgi:hypothetical protein